MAQTIEGAKRAKETLLKKFGSEEARIAWHREIGAKGGKNGAKDGAIKGFAANIERARIAGAKGGTISRRGKR